LSMRYVTLLSDLPQVACSFMFFRTPTGGIQ